MEIFSNFINKLNMDFLIVDKNGKNYSQIPL